MVEKTKFQPYDFERIYEKYVNKIYRYLYFKVQNHEEAEELVQDTFRKAWLKIEGLELTSEQVESYLYTTAKNTLYDKWRKRRIKTVDIDKVREFASQGLLPEDEAIEKEEAKALQKAMDKLPYEQQEVLRLRIFDGLSAKMAALKMFKTPGAVRSLQYRAIKNLKSMLKEMEVFKDGF